MVIDRDYTRHILTRLVQINSVNPALSPRAPGEREVAAFIHRQLVTLGLDSRIFEPEPRRATVLARLSGTGGGRSLMLNGHIDTVDVPNMPEPFSGEVRDGRVWGRGAFDMKGSIAASLAAVQALLHSRTRLRGDLWIAAVADEEYGSLGTRDLLQHLRTDAAIVTEPTALQTCLAHKGYLWIEVVITGRAAHGSRFELGIDANMKMGRILYALGQLERDLRARAPHPLVGPPSLHAATLAGGSGLSTYAAKCTLQIERRTIPGETEAGALAEIQHLVDAISADDPDFHAEVKCFFAREPFEVAPTAPIVQALDRASTRVLSRPAVHIGDTPWMDAALLQAAGIETVVCGPAGTGAHADVEWVDLDSVYQFAEILAETAIDYCG